MEETERYAFVWWFEKTLY